VASTAFEGLDANDNAFVNTTPPDPQIAVGPTHILEMVNNVGRVFTKSGSLVSTFSLDSFFGVPSVADIRSDPRLIYDSTSSRYFAAYIDRNQLDGQGDLFLAISQTNDPSGAWNKYSTSFPLFVPDYPGIGVTDDKFTISYNLYGVYTGTFLGEQTLVVQKSDVIAGISGAQVGVAFSSTDPTRFTVRPAQALTSVSDQYLTTFDYSSGGGGSLATKIMVIRITGTPNARNVTEASATSLSIQSQVAPPPSNTAGNGDCIIAQGGSPSDLGPPPCIDSGDGRMLAAIWRDGSLWSAAPAACRPSSDTSNRSCAHLIEVTTAGTPSVVQDILLGGPAGENYSWPGIMTDVSGNLYVSMTHTNSSIFAEARIAGRLATDPLNAMSGSSLLRAGNVVHTSGRWGDYLGAAVDPSDGSCVWVVGEYAKNTSGADWGTYIAATSYSGGCGGGTPTPTPPPITTATATSTVSSNTATQTSTPASSLTPTNTRQTTNTYTPTQTPTRTPTPVGQPGDVNCSHQADAIDAALLLQFGAGLFQTFPCEQNADVNHDGIVNAIDAALVLQYSAGLIGSL
jgi:hypothetical protein